jgi:REP element-mobilizing transposase RayT
MTDVWEIFSRQLFFIHHGFGVRIHSFVLMSNHFHLLISTPEANLSDAMASFMKETSRWLNLGAGRINQTYGARHTRSVIANDWHFRHAYKYVYRNPVQAGICKRVEDYSFSTLNGLFGQRHLFIPLQEDTLLTGDPEATLAWLNEKPALDNWETVGLALHRPKFSLPKDRNTKREHSLERDAL